MNISDLDESKIEQLSALIKQVYRENGRYMLFDSQPTDAYLKDMLLAKIALLGKNEAVDLVATDDGRIIGECEIIRIQDGNLAKIGIFLDKNWRRKGAGSTLLEQALDKALQMGIDEIYAEVDETNDIAIAFFLKNGFKYANFEEPHGRRIKILKTTIKP